MLNLLKKLVKMVMKVPNMIYSFAKKNPVKAGLVVFALYLCCFEDVMGTIKNLMNMGALEIPEGKEEKEQEQQAPQMDDVSMFRESLEHNVKIADVDANLEDLINDVHK